MRPSRVAKALRQVADKIEASKRPDKRLVAQDIRKIIVAAEEESKITARKIGTLDNSEFWLVTGEHDGKEIDAVLEIDTDGRESDWVRGETAGIEPGDGEAWDEVLKAINKSWRDNQ